MSRGFKITFGTVAVVALAAIVVPPLTNVRDGRGYARARTRATLRSVATASRFYHQEYGRWPVAVTDFTNNPRKLIFLELGPDGVPDGWRRPVQYRPFDSAQGYGSVSSLGKDGRTGGIGADEDMEIRFAETKKRTNHASEATSEPASSAASSSPQG